jgi:HEAT repeat protein
MNRLSEFSICFIVAAGGFIPSPAQDSTDVETPRHKAWDMLKTASESKQTALRTHGIRALGLLRDDTTARQLAEEALKDRKPEVRIAAATSLGKMHATLSIPALQSALSDPRIPVVMAAARSLRELDDEAQAYAVYYSLLTGVRKSGDGVIAQQVATLKDPKQLATIGFSEGIGFVPFAGIGWDAWRTMHKKDPNPVRAVAAIFLAHDPDPATAQALVKATHDRNWIVRAAALEAIAQRGDPSLMPKVELRFIDKNANVRFTAAAALIRLSQIDRSGISKNSGKREAHP